MRTSVTSVTDEVLAEFSGSGISLYFEAFKLDCSVRNLTDKTLDVYFERLKDFLVYLSEQGTPFDAVTKRTIQEYVWSLKDRVSDETVNGRIRACRRFFNFLIAEGHWERENPLEGLKQIRTANRVKPVIDPESMQTVISSTSRKTFEGNRNIVIQLLF